MNNLIAEYTPASTDQVHIWLKQEQDARNHEWHRYKALLDASREAAARCDLNGLRKVLILLNDPKWNPQAPLDHPSE